MPHQKPLEINAGYCFRFNPRLGLDDHLQVVITDTRAFQDKVVFVNVTTFREPFGDRACILESKDHPQITHISCIKYAEAKEVTLEALRKQLSEGNIHKVKPIIESVLDRVRQGAAVSRFIPMKITRTLEQQGIISQKLW